MKSYLIVKKVDYADNMNNSESLNKAREEALQEGTESLNKANNENKEREIDLISSEYIFGHSFFPFSIVIFEIK